MNKGITIRDLLAAEWPKWITFTKSYAVTYIFFFFNEIIRYLYFKAYQIYICPNPVNWFDVHRQRQFK